MGPSQNHIYPILNTFHLLNNSGTIHRSAKAEGYGANVKKHMFARMHTDCIEVLHGTQAYNCSPIHAKAQGIASGRTVPLSMISLLLSNPCTCSLIKDDQLELSLIDDNHVTLKLTLQLKPTSSEDLLYSLISTLLTGSMGLLFQLQNHDDQGQHQAGDHSQDHSDMDAHGYDLKYEKSHLDLSWLASLHRHPLAVGPFQKAARISSHLPARQFCHEKSKTLDSLWTPAANAGASCARVLMVAALSDRIMKQVIEIERKRKQKEHQRKLDMRAAVRQVKNQALVGKREVKTKAVFIDTQQIDDDDDDDDDDDANDITVDQRQSEYSKTKSISDDRIDEESTALQHRNRPETGSKNEQENQTRDRDDNQDERRVNNGHDPKDDVTPVKQTKKRPCEATSTSTSTATGSRTQPKKRRRRTGRLV